FRTAPPSEFRSALMIFAVSFPPSGGAAITEAGVPRTTTPQMDLYTASYGAPNRATSPFFGTWRKSPVGVTWNGCLPTAGVSGRASESRGLFGGIASDASDPPSERRGTGAYQPRGLAAARVNRGLFGGIASASQCRR